MDFTKKRIDETLAQIKTHSANSDVFAEREKQREAIEKADWVKRNSGKGKRTYCKKSTALFMKGGLLLRCFTEEAVQAKRCLQVVP